MSKGSCGSRVRQIVRRHVNRLHRCDRAVSRGGDTLLQRAHLCLQRRLVTNGARHTAQESGHLGSCLGETENVINEQQDVFSSLVSEIFRNGQTAQAHPHTGSRRLIHLSEYHGCLIDNAGLAHLPVKVVAFTGPLAHTGKHGITAVLRGNVADQLLDEHRLTYAGAAEKTDLSTLLIWTEQIYHLDAGLQHLCLGRLFGKGRSLSVNRTAPYIFRQWFIIYRLSQYIEDPPESYFSHRYGNRSPGGHRLHSADQSVCWAHGDTSHDIVPKMLSHFCRQSAAVLFLNPDSIVHFRQYAPAESDIQDSADNLGNCTCILCCHLFYSFFYPFRASAPEIISVSSCVIAPCLARL